MKLQSLFCWFGSLVLLLVAGCTTHPDQGAYAPQDVGQKDLENKAPVVLLDPGVQYSVTYANLIEKVLDDGRLEVLVNLRNRENRRIEVQANCVFKDQQGFSTGDETPFQTVILTENAQETVRFVAANSLARKYTVRVRQAR